MALQYVAAALLALAAGAATQQDRGAQQDQGARPDMKKRVAGLLAKVAHAESLAFQVTTSNPKRKPNAKASVKGTCEGPTTLWQRPGSTLVSSGARWLVREKAGDWTVCRHPTGPWRSHYLPDPRFLAARLLELLPRTEWAMATEIVQDRVSRSYVAKIDNKTLHQLLESGALTNQGAGGAHDLIFVGGGIAWNAKRRTVEGTAEIRIYDDPKTRLVTRIVANLFTKSAGTGRVFLAGGGGGVFRARIEPAKKEADDKKPKKKQPSVRTEFELSAIGTAKAEALDDAARALLAGARKKAAFEGGK